MYLCSISFLNFCLPLLILVVLIQLLEYHELLLIKTLFQVKKKKRVVSSFLAFSLKNFYFEFMNFYAGSLYVLLQDDKAQFQNNQRIDSRIVEYLGITIYSFLSYFPFKKSTIEKCTIILTLKQNYSSVESKTL